MAELQRIEEELPSPELASDDIPAKQPEGPKLVKSQEPETLDRAVAVFGAYALVFWIGDGRFPIAMEQGTDWFRGRTAPDRRRRRQARSGGDAATRGRVRQRAIGPGKAVGQRRQRVH